MKKILAYIVVLGLIGWVAPLDHAFPLDEMGTGTLKIKFEQWPVVSSLKSADISGDPNKCSINIPFRGIFSSTIPQGVFYRAVHSDGTKSSVMYMSDPPGTGKEFHYMWHKFVPPNQPYSGWVMIEGRFSDQTSFKYKSAKAAFTVQCIPHKAEKWPTAPFIVTPGENQKVLAPVKILVKPRDPYKNCTDNGVLWLSKEKKGIKVLSKPLPSKNCQPEGAVWELDLTPGLYQIRAHHTNSKYNFASDWSDWVTFEVVK